MIKIVSPNMIIVVERSPAVNRLNGSPKQDIGMVAEDRPPSTRLTIID